MPSMQLPAWLRDRRRQLRLLRLLPTAVALLALAVVMVRNADTPTMPDFEAPEGFTPAPPPTTAEPGRELPALVADVQGTTTSAVPPNAGRARLRGFVSGPSGAVPGATVRLERVVGDVTQVLDVVTGPDGRYEAAGIGGGRYRVRAFLPPTFTQPTGEVLYLRHDEDRSLDLAVDAFGEPTATVAYTPDPALLGDTVRLAIRVSARTVDADGVVRTDPLAGATVQVTASGGWSSPAPGVTTTDGAGQAQFTASCRSTAAVQLQVAIRPPTAVPGTPATTATFDVPACVDPATLTTTSTTTTTPAGPSSTTSTTG